MVVIFLTHRQTIVQTNKHVTIKLSINLGFPQSLPLFFFPYHLYHGKPLDDLAKKRVDPQDYLHNIILIAKGKSVKNNNQILAQVTQSGL